jgi:hypothetical protein
MNRHLVLLGDSIFDNAAYVAGGLPVIEHLRKRLPAGMKATLVAHDGDVTVDVANQLSSIPPDATDLVLSVGGNDALGVIPLLSLHATSVMHALKQLSEIRQSFHQDYRTMIRQLAFLDKPLAICTIYEAVPGLTDELKTALSLFNDVIVREALAAAATVIDLRQICTEMGDYSEVSPIEPSAQGGGKIAAAIHDWATA